MVSERSKNVSYSIRDILVPARKLEAEGHKVLKLNIGDPNKYDFDTPQFIRDALKEIIDQKHNGYAPSEGVPELKEAIARDNANPRITAERIIPTAGVSEAIHFLFAALLNPGDEILVPSPTYPQYIVASKFYGGVPVEYDTLEEDGWQPDLTDLEKKISAKTRALCVINPNNPTGAVYSKKTLQAMANLAGQHNIPLICDEIYDDMVYEDYTSMTSVANDVPFIRLNGISKVYLAPGWRVGYMAFSEGLDELLDACTRLARLRLSSNSICQYAYVAALNGPRDHVEETKKKLNERRQFVYKRANEINGLSMVMPKGAFYAFPKVDGLVDDKKWCLDLLQQEKVLVVPGGSFGARGVGHFRIVYLPPLDVLEQAFDGIERFMRE